MPSFSASTPKMSFVAGQNASQQSAGQQGGQTYTTGQGGQTFSTGQAGHGGHGGHGHASEKYSRSAGAPAPAPVPSPYSRSAGTPRSKGKKLLDICRAIGSLLTALAMILLAAWAIWMIYALKKSGRAVTGAHGVGLWEDGEPGDATITASWHGTTTLVVLHMEPTGSEAFDTETTRTYTSSRTRLTSSGAYPTGSETTRYYWTTEPVATRTVVKTDYWPVYSTNNATSRTLEVTDSAWTTGTAVVPIQTGTVLDSTKMVNMLHSMMARDDKSITTSAPTATPTNDPHDMFEPFEYTVDEYTRFWAIKMFIHKFGFIPNRELVYPLLVTVAVISSLLAAYFLYRLVRNCIKACKPEPSYSQPLPDVYDDVERTPRRPTSQPMQEKTFHIPSKHAQMPSVRIAKKPKHQHQSQPQPKVVHKPAVQPATTGTVTSGTTRESLTSPSTTSVSSVFSDNETTTAPPPPPVSVMKTPTRAPTAQSTTQIEIQRAPTQPPQRAPTQPAPAPEPAPPARAPTEPAPAPAQALAPAKAPTNSKWDAVSFEDL